jgi:hypothetical protein
MDDARERRRSSVGVLLQPHLESARRRSVARVAASAHAAAAEDIPEQDDIVAEQDPGRRAPSDDAAPGHGEKKADVPVWWLFVISSYCIPLGITNTLIGSILLPPLIQKCVGNESKQAALGLA